MSRMSYEPTHRYRCMSTSRTYQVYYIVLENERKQSICTANQSYDPYECSIIIPVLCLPNELSTPREMEYIMT